MATKKSYVGLEDAYDFFLKHSNQLPRAMDAMGAVITNQVADQKHVRLCFLGCGDVDLILYIVKALQPKHSLDVTLIDTHPQWLDACVERVEEAGVATVAAH